jgi:hypothetical protein
MSKQMRRFRNPFRLKTRGIRHHQQRDRPERDEKVARSFLD